MYYNTVRRRIPETNMQASKPRITAGLKDLYVSGVSHISDSYIGDSNNGKLGPFLRLQKFFHEKTSQHLYESMVCQPCLA